MPNQTPKKYTGKVIGVAEARALYGEQIKPICYTQMSAMLLRLSRSGVVKQHFKGGYDRAEFLKELGEMQARLAQTKPEWVVRPSW